MKWLKWILGIVAVLLVVVFLAVTFFMGGIIKTAVETMGPKVTGVPVTLDGAEFSLFTGKVRLNGLVVANPEGFKTPSAFELGDFRIDLSVPSLFGDTIVIEEILIDGPHVTMEGSLKGSNIKRLMEQIEERAGPKDAAPGPEAAPEAEAAPGKKVRIDDFLFRDGKLRFSATMTGGQAITIPLPPIHLQGIGKEQGGASIREVTAHIMAAVVQAVGQAVMNSGKLLGEGAKLLEGAALKGVDLGGVMAGEGADAAAATAGKAAETAGAAAEKTMETAGAAAGKAAETAGAAADKAQEAVTEGAKKILGGVGGLLKHDE
ncbi:MAG: hypothetical protein JW951_10165 [Lentisphaerae bacterium]|nr:hypothetical protein [Lentisphaerota bacterium]